LCPNSKGLQQHKNISIDSIGVGYNEGTYNTTWIKETKAALVAAGLAHVRTIATDDCCGGEYRIVNAMKSDPELDAAIDILGAHCVGIQNNQKNPSAEALAVKKPLWNTEQHFGW
jgi:O-glycosyl hydrolase